jgi:ketosteroid isomerase-like protein
MTSANSGSATAVSAEAGMKIDSANRAFEKAIASGDGAGAARGVYTRDCTIMPPGAPALHGREAAEQFWPAAVAQLGIEHVQLETVELHALGPGAYEVGRATLRLAGGGEATAKYVVIWREEDGQWRWHVDIWNLDA